jgi:hypothetical protein
MGGHRDDSNERQHVAERGRTPGRDADIAQPPRAPREHAEPERYPPVGRDDSVEAPSEGRLGPEGDPAEGKRR